MTEKEANNERQIARSIGELPPLPEGYVRAIHITTPDNAEAIFKSGLDYEKYGMAMSMAQSYGKQEEAIYGSSDPRFNYPGLKAVVMDIPNAEWRIHNRVDRNPGRIPADLVVGIVDTEPQDDSK